MIDSLDPEDAGRRDSAVGRTTGQAPEVDGVTYLEGRPARGARGRETSFRSRERRPWATTWWERSMRPNLPNSMSLFRVLMVPVFMVFLLVDRPGQVTSSRVVFRRRGRQRLPRRLFRPPPPSDHRAGSIPGSAGRQAAGDRGPGLAGGTRTSCPPGLLWWSSRGSWRCRDCGWWRPPRTWSSRPAGGARLKTPARWSPIVALIIEPRWLKPEWTLWGQSVTWYLVLVMLVLTVVSGSDYFVRRPQQLRGPLSARDRRGRWCRARRRTEATWLTRRQRLQRLFIAVPLPVGLLGFVQAAPGHGAADARLAAHPARSSCTSLWPSSARSTEAKAAAARAVVDSLPPDMGGEGASRGSSCCLRPARPGSSRWRSTTARGVRPAVRACDGRPRGGGSHAAGETAVPAPPHRGPAAGSGRSATKV